DRQLERDKAYLAGYREQMKCHLGNFEEYWDLRERARHIRERAQRGHERARLDQIRGALMKLRPGDVIFVPAARRRGLAVVLNNTDGKPTVFAQDRKTFRLKADFFRDPPQAVTKIQLPRSGSARSAGFRRDLAARLVALDVRPPTPERKPVDEKAAARAEALERKAREHPCHACPEREKHERWGLRASRLEEQIRGV